MSEAEPAICPERLGFGTGTSANETPGYLSRQLLTYLGNKRALLGPIAAAVAQVKSRLGKAQLQVFDAFSGSGVVSRLLKAHAARLVSNDLEDYAAVVGRCFLRNYSTVDQATLAQLVAELNARVAHLPLAPGFIEQLYAPRDENHITPEDRVFYTRANARCLDNYRRMIAQAPAHLCDLLLGPLLSQASIHTNTAGIFKGFYKNHATGLGQFGGSGSNALQRILGLIRLELPLLSRYECEVEVLQQDANAVARQLRGLDLAYIDPPYNQHPYGSNYFMLNLLTRYERPAQISHVAGIPTDWRRSGYNVRAQALPLLTQLLTSLDAPFLLISFNNEGFITPTAMHTLLAPLGTVTVVETRYNAFRGSRSLKRRPLHVTEQLFLVERS